MMLRRTVAAVTAALMLASPTPRAEPAAAETQPVGPKLTPKLQSLLTQEMVAILQASQAILDALVRGDDGRVAEQAQAIHDSFILEREMTEQDRRDLMQAAPPAFVERDRAFHELTGNLAAAARRGDRERQLELFGRMVESCSGCHARYATNRFTGFADE